MKKLLAVSLVLVTLCVGSSALAENDGIDRATITDKLVLYFPNRIMDLLDTFSINLGIGPVVEARLMGTRLADSGAGIGRTYKAYKSFNRQYGFGVEEGWYWSFISVGDEDFTVMDGTDWIHKYVETRAGVPDPTTRLYDFYDGARDYWAIGGALGLLVDGELYIHPVEWLDLALGFVLIDIRNDDLVLDSFR